MIVSLIFLAATIAAGLAAASFIRAKLSGVERCALAAAFGIALAAPATFILAWSLGVPGGMLAFSLLAGAAAYAVRERIAAVCDWRADKKDVAVATFLFLAAALTLSHNQLDWDGEKYVIENNSLGDLMYHIRIMTSFAYADNFPPEEPIYAGSPLTYHFLFDFYSGCLLAGGLSLRDAILVPAALALASFLTLVYSLGTRMAGSRAAGAFAVILIYFSGGWAFLESYQSGASLDDWAKTAHDYYGQNKLGYVFGNMTETALQSQRTLLAGLAVFAGILLALAATLDAFPQGEDAKRRDAGGAERDALPALAACGVIAGLMPLLNGHAFMAAMLCAFFTILAYSPRALAPIVKNLAAFFAPALVIAVPSLAYLLLSGTAGNMKFNFLWETDSPLDAAIFWLRNLGPFLFALILGLGIAGGRRLLFFAGPLAVFALANVIQFSYFEFDNYKLFATWFVVGALYAGLLLAETVKRGRYAGAAAVTLFLVLACASGALAQMDNFNHRYEAFLPAHFALADWVNAHVPARAVLLAEPGYYHPVAELTGREVALGPYVWVVTHGFNYSARDGDVRAMYSGAPDAAALLKKYGVSYVVVGAYERGNRDLNINDSFFGDPGLFEKEYDETLPGIGRWEIFRVKAAGG